MRVNVIKWKWLVSHFFCAWRSIFIFFRLQVSDDDDMNECKRVKGLM